ncbi:MAG TPA: carbonic anhydrase [Candidatus Dormibacteraeota bacterium]|nr:carbonic anhydrase [Candidatus Dormibacteraeota bacterium]
MDARLDACEVLRISDGCGHVIRNAGGIVTDDVLRSLTISQRLLGTREVAVVHHTGCGMLTFRDDEVTDRILAETGVRPPFTLGAFADLDADVRESVARIASSPFLPFRDAVRGYVYDLDTGELREVAPGPVAT